MTNAADGAGPAAGPTDPPARRRGRRARRVAVLGGLATTAAVALTLLVGSGSALAASHLVTTAVDAPDSNPGDGICASAAHGCTLRAAIQEANATLVADEVVVPAGVYALTVPAQGDNLAENGDLDITRPITVTGAGLGAVTITADRLDRVLEIHASAGTVSVTGLTLRDGAVADTGGALRNASSGTVRFTGVALRDSSATEAGGAVATGSELSAGRLELIDSFVTGSETVGEGGGVHVGAGTFTAIRTEISGNSARGGGGIFNAGESTAAGVPGRVELQAATVRGNTALASGGGVGNDGEGTFTATGSVLDANLAHGDGGGVHAGSKGSLTIIGGAVTANRANGDGGGVHTDVEGSARIDGVTFARNEAGATVVDENGVPQAGEGAGGGLVAGGSGAVTITASTFEANRAAGPGGGVLIENNTTVRITGGAVRDNRTDAGGAGIQNEGNRVTVAGATVTGNVAALDGGGVQSEGSGEFTIENTTIAHNTAENGGGLANQADGGLRVVGTTIWDNRALLGGSDDSGLGGGVYGLGDAGANYENTTITGNYAQVRGGGLYIDADADVRVSHVTIATNTAPAASGVGGEITSVNFPVEPSPSVLFRNTVVAGNLLSPNCNFAVGSLGGNLEDGDSCYLRGQRDRQNAPGAGLDAVADNGGPTMTMAPRGDSPVIEGGVGPCPATDQRGVARPANRQCDIGAVEFDGPFPVTDVTPPDTAYLTGPRMDSETTSVFTFTGADDTTPAGELLYECRLLEIDPTEPPEPPDPTEPPDPEELFVGCPNPWQVALIDEGTWRFEVRAVDRAGNVDPSADVHDFTVPVDGTAPQTVFVETPRNPSPFSTATFTFTGDDGSGTDPRFLEFECRIDSVDPEAWLECANPASFSNLMPGSHTVQVRATDLADNVDPTPATFTWTVAPPTDCDASNITVTATADTTLDESSTVENFGATEELTVRSAAPGRDAHALVRFPLPAGAAGCALESATLRLHGEGDAGRVLAATPVTQPWAEGTATWNDRPATGGPAVTTTSGAGEGYREWDVTQHVAAGVAGNGWQIADQLGEDPAGAEQTFASSEAVDVPPVPPQLVLRYVESGTPTPPAPPDPVGTDVVTCGQVITESTRLAGDVTGCPGEGIVIGAPDVVLDLNGFTVASGIVPEPGEEEGLPAGIRNGGHSHVIIRNGTVRDFGHGVRLLPGTTYNQVTGVTFVNDVIAGVEMVDADNGRNGNTVRGSTFRGNGDGVALVGGTEGATVVANTFTGNLGVAVRLVDAHANTVEGNTVSGLTGDPALDSDGGLSLEGSGRNRIAGNRITDAGDAGLAVAAGSHRNRIEGNTVLRASDSGISVDGSDRSEIVGNVVHLVGGAGVGVTDATGGIVTGNDVRHNAGGIELGNAADVLVEGNDARGSTAGGILVEGGASVLILRNLAGGTNGDGIAVVGELGHRVEGNTASDNNGDGVALEGSGHTALGNVTHHNLGWGVDADPGTIDGGGNVAAGNAEPLQCRGVVCQGGPPVPPAGPDLAPPDTAFAATPPDPSGTLDTAAFTFTGTDVDGAGEATPPDALRFECRLDAPPDDPAEPADNWTGCVPGVSIAFLPVGEHRFEVRAVDPADLVDPTPARFEWTVLAAPPGPDALAPETTIVTGPADPSPDDPAVIAFRGSDNATPGPYLTFTCRIDGGAWTPCQSPVSYPVANGPHTVEVRATDLAGRTDPTPALRSWTTIDPPADTTAPDTTITAGPDPTGVDPLARFTWTATEPGVTYECRLDGGPWTACTTPDERTVTVGSHTLAVRARDAAGNVDLSPATRSWTVTAAPVDRTVSCGQVLTTSTRVLNDLVDCGGDGLVIGANAITVDLNGATIDGVGQGSGIRNDGFDSVTVTSGFVQEFFYGVALNQGAANNIVSGLTVQLNAEAGVALTNADDGVAGNTVRDSAFVGNGVGALLTAGTQFTVLRANTISGNAGQGVYVLGAPDNRIEGNDVTGSGDAGIAVEASPRTTLASNTLDANSDAALLVELASHDPVVSGNTVLGSEAGVIVSESQRPRITDNVVNGSSDLGIDVDTASGGVITGNDVRFNGGGIGLYHASDHRISGNDASEGGTGIEVGDESFRNTIIGNRADGNDSEGISIGGEAPAGSGNVIEGNSASGNAADGIVVGAISHMIRGNTANDNGGYGIYAKEGSVAGVNLDGGFNRAVGNVGSGAEQCFNVRCDGGPGLPVDQVPPATNLLSAPPDPTARTSATFTFDGTDNASGVTFQCRLDGSDDTAFVPCTSPTTYPGLAIGQHTFAVRAVDFIGNVDGSPAVHTWTVQAPDPGVPPRTTVTSGPDRTTVATSATLQFQANEEGVTFECRRDSLAFEPCASPVTYANLTVGAHTFEVRGTDPQGNVESPAAVYSWTVGTPPVPRTVSCGQTLTQSTLVQNDLVDCGGNGLVAGADGITIDLGGRSIDGTGQGTGVSVIGRTGVTVTNGTIDEFDLGVDLTDSPGGSVSGLTLSGAQYGGVGLYNADDAVVRGNTLTENEIGLTIQRGTTGALVAGNVLGQNPGTGIHVTGSSGNRIEDNDIADSSREGVWIQNAAGNVVAGNDLLGNDAGGIVISEGSVDNIAVGNTVTATGSAGIEVNGANSNDLISNVVGRSGDAGIALEGANDGIVRGNDVRGNPGGIDLTGSSRNRIEQNNAGSSSGTGISLEGSSLANQLIGNQANANNGQGIYLGDSAPNGQANVLDGNTASNNGGEGIMVNASRHTIRNNTADSNDGWGIYAVPGNTDGGGNRATGNVEGAQCSGVACASGPPPGAPDTSIVLKPADPTNSRRALFTFTGSDDTTTVGNLEFECRLDSVAWQECENPQEYAALAPGRHVFEVRAVDAFELVDPTPARHEWTYAALPPGVAPVTTITAGPDDPTSALEALFTFTANEPDVDFQCSLDGAPYTACAFAVEAEFDESEAGAHTFRVRAVDVEGNVGAPAVWTWTILGVTTVITEGPAGETTDTFARFVFAANVPDATFRCSLDLGPFVACTSPRTYTNLAVGEHLLRIVAEDVEGREQAEAAEYEWEVIPDADVLPPNAVITLGPPAGPSDVATFLFTGSDNMTAPAALEFECRLDGAAFEPCTSPHTYPNPDQALAPGVHTFEVRATDLEDNVDPTPAARTWEFTGDVTGPVTTIVTAPAARTGLTAGTFTFAADDPYATFTCALDGAAAEPCSSPEELQDLVPGSHSYTVVATDLSGNAGPPAVHDWEVVGPPSTTLVATPPAVATVSSATFDFTADQPDVTFTCALDGAVPVSCQPGVTYTGLVSGPHEFAVRARNAFGVVEVAPVAFTWTVQLPPPPDTTITSAPGAVTSATTATFAFSADRPTQRFECALDGAPFSTCVSPRTYSGLIVEEHDFAVRAVGTDGQVEPVPATYEWEIVPDTTPPDVTLAGSAPPSGTATTATIAFAVDEPGSTVTCSLDGAPFAGCTSPVTLSGLAVGTHTFRVAATDPAGNADLTPLAVTWTVQAPAPTCPTAPVTVAADADAWVLRSSASQNNGTAQMLRVDAHGTQTARALVRFGLPALPAGCRVEGATLRVNAATATTGRTLQALRVTGTWAETGVTWTSQPATGGTAATAASGTGVRTFAVTDQVAAMYASGNFGFQIRDSAESGSTARRQELRSREASTGRPELVITFGPAGPPPDTTAPDTTITSGPATPTTATSATFAFTASETGSAFTCSVDGGAWTACTSPTTVTGVGAGSHEIRE